MDIGCDDATDDDETDPASECLDGIDNDLDGWTDMADPVCTSAAVLTEDDGTGGIAECNDGIDNDCDGETDADDTECSGAKDDSEGS